jgi:ribosome maturation factor RimP
MAIKLEAIRSAASRVAASHGLEVVGVEFIGPSKERTLRVFLEKNAEQRAQLKAAIAAGAAQKVGAAEAVGTGAVEAEAAKTEVAGDANEALLERLVQQVQEGELSLDRLEQLSGITHEDCAAFSRDFGVLLDVEDLVPGAEYTLEASSPGLDRKLTKPEDFQRFTGSLVKVQTFEPIRNNRHWQGRLTAGTGSIAEAAITLDLNAVKQNSRSRKTGVSVVEIALENIEKAQLVPEISSCGGADRLRHGL